MIYGNMINNIKVVNFDISNKNKIIKFIKTLKIDMKAFQELNMKYITKKKNFKLIKI